MIEVFRTASLESKILWNVDGNDEMFQSINIKLYTKARDLESQGAILKI